MSLREQQDLRLFFKGVPVEVPYWVLILEAANGDPLRAQEIEAGVSEYWWRRHLDYNRERAQAQEEMKRNPGFYG